MIEFKDAVYVNGFNFFFVYDYHQLQHVTFEQHQCTVLLGERGMPQYGHIRFIKTVINKYSHIFVAVSDLCAHHAGLNSFESET